MTVDTPVRRPPGKEGGRAGLLHRVSGWSMRHAGVAVLLWIAALVAVTAGSALIGDNYRNDNSLPGTDSQRVTDIFREHQPQGDTASVQIVLHADGGLRPEKQRIASMLAVVGDLPHVAAVADPFTAPGSLSQDGRTAYATVGLDTTVEDMPVEDVRTIIHRAQEFAAPGVQVEVGGDLARSAAESEGGAAEGAGILAALVILVFLFGSLLAATLPLLTAVFAVGSTLGLLVLASHLFTVPGLHRAGDDAGRPGGRHRLRVADLLPLPPRVAEGRHRSRDRVDGCPRHRRPVGHVRRLHRGDRACSACWRWDLVRCKVSRSESR